MNENFILKVNNGEYISNKLWQKVKNEFTDFDIDKYNEDVINKLSIKYKDYFEHIYDKIDPNVKLDSEQINAILSDEDSSLIIAGAGTGKTTTMVSKVKYLVDIKKINPQKILVMSYTKKATQELEDKIVGKLGIDAYVTTFHSLGLNYIRKIFLDRKCSVVDYNDREDIFYKYFCDLFKNKEKLKRVLTLFEKELPNSRWIVSKYFKDHFEEFDEFSDLLKSYAGTKMDEAKRSIAGIRGMINEWVESQINSEYIITLNDEYVRSAGECKIANFLYEHGIDYHYEKIYDELMEDNHIYKPDFTLDYAGQPVYIEYFGLDDEEYLINKNKKIEFHKEHKNIFISIDRMPLDKISEYLDIELKKIGFKYKDKTDEEIYTNILTMNKLFLVNPLKNFYYSCIESIKESVNREKYIEIVKKYIDKLKGDERSEAIEQFNLINDFYVYYSKNLFGASEYKFDYADLLFYANKYIENLNYDNNLNFDYVIIDEYQDISQYKYELLRKTVNRNSAKICAVGDDWQSIYAFSGSRIEYVYSFTQYFKDAKMFKITKTYRNCQELIDVSGEFIMKNSSQIKKKLISDKHIENPIKFVLFDDEHQTLLNTIMHIHKNNPKASILILARKNYTIDHLFDDKNFKDELGTKITVVGYDDIKLEGMTIHKSKGLTFDEVIVMGLSNDFPSGGYRTFWLNNIFKYRMVDENISFAEERRVFYVALTRTKNNVYLLVNKDVKFRSPFIDEIVNINGKLTNNK